LVKEDDEKSIWSNCVAGYWRSRTNGELGQLYGESDIVTEIKKKIEKAGTCVEDA